MDSNYSLILINLIINLLIVVDHFVNRIRSSKCFGASLEMNDNKNNELDNNKIKELIDVINNNKSNKKDENDPINKL